MLCPRSSDRDAHLTHLLKGGRATAARLASAACNCRVLRALDLFFKWLLKKSEPQAGAARLAFNVGPHAANPCREIEKAEPKRDARGEGGRRLPHRTSRLETDAPPARVTTSTDGLVIVWGIARRRALLGSRARRPRTSPAPSCAPLISLNVQ